MFSMRLINYLLLLIVLAHVYEQYSDSEFFINLRTLFRNISDRKKCSHVMNKFKL